MHLSKPIEECCTKSETVYANLKNQLVDPEISRWNAVYDKKI